MSLLRAFLRLFRGKLGWAIRLAITVGLFALLFTRFVDVNELIRDIQRITPGWLLVAFLVQAVGMTANILRWDLLLKGQGLRVPLRHLVGTFLAGRFFSTFLPSTLGLDAYRAYDIARHAQATVDSVAVILVEKVIGFFALSLLVLVTVPAGVNMLPAGVLVSIFVVFCVPVTLAFILLMKPGVVAHLLDLNFPGRSRVEGRLRQAVHAVTVYEHQRWLLLRAMLLGLLVHGCTVLMYCFTALAVGAPTSFTDILFVSPLMIVATLGVPTIGGEGAREFTFVGLLGRIGVPESQAFLLGHLGFWCGLILSLPGVLFYALRPDTYRPDIQKDEARRMKDEGVS